MINNDLKKANNHFWAKFILDGFLLLIAFGLAYFLKRRDLNIGFVYLKFLPFYFLCWLVSNLLTQKFRTSEGKRHLLRLKPYIVSLLLFIGLLSLILFGLKLYDLSRFIVFGSIGIHFLLEILFLSGIYIPIFKKKEEGAKGDFSYLFLLLEFLLITTSFFAIHHYKRGTIILSDDYIIILSLIYFLWIFIGLVIHKFRIRLDRNYLRTIWPFIKSMFLVVCIVSFFVFGFRIMEFSRLIVFGSLAGFASFEILIVSVVYLYKKPQETDEPVISHFKAPLLNEQEIIDRVTKDGNKVSKKYHIQGNEIQSNLIGKKLERIYLKRSPDIFKFIDREVDLSGIDILTSVVIDTGNPYNVEILPQDELEFFLNLHEMNDFRRVNRYLIEVNDKLKTGGIFISKFQPKEKRRIHFTNKYPFYLANILYFFDFLGKRVCPKLPVLKKIYFVVTKGRNRVLSMAEGLGRLYYCGFEVISMQEIDHFVYFIAKKAKKPSTDKNPSYGLLFKMKRIGKNGKIIHVYKFRTMYPYSEYLQDFVLKKFGYSVIGKPASDFRVTSWGKFLRRFWLDELPQLINVFKGEMRLVGIRPISARFLEELPEDLKKMRMKHKPGCVPAYVSLLKQSKDGFIEAESIYLLEKEKHPVKTDIKFFFKAIYNIVTNKIRSE